MLSSYRFSVNIGIVVNMLLRWLSRLLWLGKIWLEFFILVWCFIRFLIRLFMIDVVMVNVVIMISLISCVLCMLSS